MDLKLFVMSDLHAFDSTSLAGRTEPSFFDISRIHTTHAGDPIKDLKTLIATGEDNLPFTADYLLCCGDFSDRAHPSALKEAWQAANDVGTLLKVRQVVATVGNHDVDSRHQHNDHDAKGALLELHPRFPFADETQNNQFWTHHFVVFSDKPTGVRFVVLNSSGYHGESVPKDISESYTHGRVSARTLRRLIEHLQTLGPAPLNIAVCHHHPQKHSELNLQDYDDMKGGYELLSKLDPVAHGPWLFFHGHKHHPKISYAQGGTSTPIIFSAGSCAAMLQPDLSGVLNQVYEVKLKVSANPTSSCLGTFRAWDWAPNVGWQLASSQGGLPGRGGFGYHGDLGELAERIQKAFQEQIMWKHLRGHIPELEHVLPSDLRQLIALLKSRFAIKVEDGKNGEPVLLEK